MADIETEIYKALREGQQKHTYFLLAAAAAAIAFAVTQTQGLPMAESQLPLGAAALFWGLSFFFGCTYVHYTHAVLYANANVLQAERGGHPGVGNNPLVIAAASEGMREAIEKNRKRAERAARAQFAFLIGGAILYIAWHALEMWERSI